MPPLHAPRIAGTSGDGGEGERESSEPTPQEFRAPKKAPNEAKLESTQDPFPPKVKSSATGPAGRQRSRSAAGCVVPRDDPFDPIAPAGEGKERAWGSRKESGE